MGDFTLTGYGTWDEVAVASGADQNFTVQCTCRYRWHVGASAPSSWESGKDPVIGLAGPTSLRAKDGESLWIMAAKNAGDAPQGNVIESDV